MIYFSGFGLGPVPSLREYGACLIKDACVLRFWANLSLLKYRKQYTFVIKRLTLLKFLGQSRLFHKTGVVLTQIFRV